MAKDAVDLQKKKNLVEAARAYLDYYHLRDVAYSFDIITVVGTEVPFKITHIKNAYTENEVWRQRHHKKEFEVLILSGFVPIVWQNLWLQRMLLLDRMVCYLGFIIRFLPTLI